MARNVLVFSVALLVGLGLAWLLLAEHTGGSGSGAGIERSDGGEGPANEGALSAAGTDGADEPQGPVLFGRSRAERKGLGGVAGRVADVADDRAIPGARLVLAGVGFGDEEVQTRGISLEDGTFQLPEVPAGDDYVLLVEAEGKPERTWPGISVRDGVVTNLGTVWLGAKLDFEGRVVDAAGLGIGGAEVRLYVGHFSLTELIGNLAELFADLDREPEPHARALTGTDGVFALPAQDPGPVTLVVRAPGFTPGFLAAVVAPSSESTKPYVIRLSEGTVVVGRVEDTSGRGISGARIAVLSDNDPFAFLYGRSFVDTLGDGSFRVDTAGSGKVQLLATSPGYPLTMTKVEPGDENVRIVLERGATLVVRLLTDAESRPIEDAQVMLATSASGSLSESGQSLSTGTTDRTGSVTFDVKPGQLQMVMVTAPSRPAGMWIGGGMGVMVPGAMKGPEDPTIKPGRREVVFRMQDTILVRGRVLDESGAGIAGARVMTFGGFQFGRPVRADAEGAYELPITRGAMGIVVARAPGFVQTRESVGLRTDVGEVIEKDITLVRAAVVSGRVLDEAGRPIAGAQVKLDSGETGGMGVAIQMMGVSTGVTGSNGRYVLDGVSPSDETRILAHRPGYVDQASEPFSVGQGGSVKGKDIVLTQGLALDVLVEDPSGRPLAGAKVEFVYAREDVVTWDAFSAFRGDATRRTDRKGHVLEETVPPSTVTITATHPEWASSNQTVTLTGGQTSPVAATVTMRRAVTLEGKVLSAKGKPLEGASVVVVGQNRRGGWVSATTDEAGRFELKRVPAGAVTLRVNASDHVGKKVEVAGPTPNFEIRLQAQDPESARQRARLMGRLVEITEQLQAASSDEERQALTRELQTLQQELMSLDRPDLPSPPSPDEPVPVTHTTEVLEHDLEEEIEER